MKRDQSEKTCLTTHAAVDGKVDWIRERNKEIGEQNQDIDDVIVEDSELERGVEYVQNGENGQRNLDDEETGHDDDEHQSRAIRVPQFPALACLPVLFEELVPLLLGAAQRSEEQNVEHDERSARTEVDANHTEPEV